MSGESENVGFPTTTWSLVGPAGDNNDEYHREALEQLLQLYMPALRTRLRRKGIQSAEADDFLQTFIQNRILEKELIAVVDLSKGKFRTLLCTALDRFLANEFRRRNTQKRRADQAAPLGENVLKVESSGKTQDSFDVAWARETLAETLRRMKADCEQQQRHDIWEVFYRRVIDPMLNGVAPVSYGALVDQYGFSTPAQAHNVLVTGKRTFQRMLRGLVAEYALNEEDVEAEINDLIAILSSEVP